MREPDKEKYARYRAEQMGDLEPLRRLNAERERQPTVRRHMECVRLLQELEGGSQPQAVDGVDWRLIQNQAAAECRARMARGEAAQAIKYAIADDLGARHTIFEGDPNRSRLYGKVASIVEALTREAEAA